MCDGWPLRGTVLASAGADLTDVAVVGPDLSLIWQCPPRGLTGASSGLCVSAQVMDTGRAMMTLTGFASAVGSSAMIRTAAMQH